MNPRGREHRTPVYIALLTILLLSTTGTAYAADLRIAGTDLPDRLETGDNRDVEVEIENLGSKRIEFTEESSLELRVEGERVTSETLLEKPNYTDPPEYLSVKPGSTGTWDLTFTPRTTGEKEVAILLKGPYRYGADLKSVEARYTKDVTLANPPVEGFDIWITKYDRGIEATVSIRGGHAYTGNASLEFLDDDGGVVARRSLQLEGGTTGVAEVGSLEEGGGPYELRVKFGGKTSSKTFTLGDRVSRPGTDTDPGARELGTGSVIYGLFALLSAALVTRYR